MTDQTSTYTTKIHSGEGLTIGEHNRIYNFFQAPQNRNIAAKAISFVALIEEKTTDFVGRQFVFDALDDFLSRNSSGYFAICGEPGIGKTALMAQLVRQRGYPHHFNVSQDNIRTAAQFIENTCAQVIARYSLPYKQFPEDVTRDSSFLVKLLQEAAANLKNRPVVLVVDALDEAERDTLAVRANVLYLPSSLPEGVYLVVTSRPLDELRLDVSRRQDLFLEPDSSGNLADIQAYVGNSLNKDAVLRKRIADWGKSEAEFVGEMVHKSEGNFIYLRFVLLAISEGKFVHGSIDELPKGLQEYYRVHWRQMKAAVGAEFEPIYTPVVCFLAVAREPVDVEQVSFWTKIPPAKVLTAVREWREFLEEVWSDKEMKYRVYHTSFKDFLDQQVKLNQYDVLILNTYIQNLDFK